MGCWKGETAVLKQRIATAVIMAAVLFLPRPALAAVFAVVVCLGAWEWSRLAGLVHPAARAAYVLVLSAGLAWLYVYCNLAGSPTREQVQPLLGLACLWWSFALLWVKSFPASAIIWRSVPVRCLMGILILAPAWLAAVFLLSLPRGGVLMVVLVMVVVAADVGAYFAGKTFGRHQLAPSVSPNKTWEGFGGGLASCLVLALLLWYLLPPGFEHVHALGAVTVALATALASVVGDLTVSMVKRESGHKDSGKLLPGHGGLLDRLDSICGAAPVFALGLLLAGW